MSDNPKHTKAVSACQFLRDKNSTQWEDGVAMLNSPGGDAQLIFPASGTSPTDALLEVYDFIIRPEKGTFTFQGE